MNLQCKDKIIRVLKALFSDVQIILYGSRARGDAHENSDIDIAIDAGKRVSRFDINEARSMFEESNIIFKIDIVDYHAISDALRKQIDKDSALWSD